MQTDAIRLPGALSIPSLPKADGRLARDFEAMLLAPMVDAMLPHAGAVFGESPGADVWRSQFAASIAGAMAERGVLGLGSLIETTLANHPKDGPA